MVSLISFTKLILVVDLTSETLKVVDILVFQSVARYDGACDFVKFKSVAFDKLIGVPKLEYSPFTFCNWSLTVKVTDEPSCPCGDKVSPLFGA